jgi:hypothetical protein
MPGEGRRRRGEGEGERQRGAGALEHWGAGALGRWDARARTIGVGGVLILEVVEEPVREHDVAALPVLEKTLVAALSQEAAELGGELCLQVLCSVWRVACVGWGWGV